jgi:hypothetical protein
MDSAIIGQRFIEEYAFVFNHTSGWLADLAIAGMFGGGIGFGH